MESTINHIRKFTPLGVEDYIIQYPRTIRPTAPDSSPLPAEEEEEDGSSLSLCVVQGSSAAQLRGHRAAPARTRTPPFPVHRGPPGLRQDAVLRRTAWLKIKYRQRMRLHMQHKRVESRQIEQLEMCEAGTHSSSLPPPPIPMSAAATIFSHDPPPLLRLLDPQDRGIFAPRPVLTVTLQDYFGATNIFLQVPTEGMQAAEAARMILREQRDLHEALPAHYYRMLHVFTPHRMHTVAPDEMVLPQPSLRAITPHTDSTYFLTVATSHYKVEEDEKLEYCCELLPCGRKLQEARYSEVLKGRHIALRARVRAREDMLRLVEGVGGGQLQLEGCSMDEAVLELVHCGFSSDPEEMMYRCGDLDEFWKERYEDGHDGWRQLGCLPHPATIEAPKVVKERATPYLTSLNMGPRGRHWYPDYLYLRRAMAAAVSGRQLLERLTEELAHYHHHMHHLASFTPIELFIDDREALLERLYEEALAEHEEEQQQAVFLSQLEAKQSHVSSNHLAGVTVLRQLPLNFNDFKFCLDMCAYVLSIHAYDLALKMAIKEFCDLRGYYLFRSTIMRLIRKDRREILEVLKDGKNFMFGFINRRESTIDPGTSNDCLNFDALPGHPDDWGGAIPSEQFKAPGISRHSPDMTLHHKDKEHRSKGKRCASQQGRKLSQHRVRGKLKGFHCTGMINTYQRSKSVHRQHTNCQTVCIQNEIDGKYKHHRNYVVHEQLRTSPVPTHCRTGSVLESQHHRIDTVPQYHTNDIAPEQHRTGTVSQHHRIVTGPLNHKSGAVPDHQKIGAKSEHLRTGAISRHYKSDNGHVHHRSNTAPQHHRSGTVPDHHRSDTVPEHHRSGIVPKHHRATSTVPKHHRTDTICKHHRTSTVPKHHRTSTISKHHRISTISKHHRTGTVSKHHRTGTVPKHHRTGTISKHHRTGTISKHHRTGIVSEHHQSGTVLKHYRTSTVPEHPNIYTVSQHHRTNTVPYLPRTGTLPQDQHHTIHGHNRTGTVSQHHRIGIISECHTYDRDWKQRTVDAAPEQFVINNKSKDLRNGYASRQNTPVPKHPSALIWHHDRVQGHSHLETTTWEKAVKNSRLSIEHDHAKYISCKLSCPLGPGCDESSGYHLDTCQAEDGKELSMVFCNGETTTKVPRLCKKQELMVTHWQGGGSSVSSAGAGDYDGERVSGGNIKEEKALKCDKFFSSDTEGKNDSVLIGDSDGDRSLSNDGEDEGVRVLHGESEVEGDGVPGDESEDAGVHDDGSEGDRVLYVESKGAEVYSVESEGDKALDSKCENEGHRILSVESESEGDKVINSESEGDRVISGENEREGSTVLVNERVLSGNSESEGDIAITGEKEGDRVFGKGNEIIFERDYEDENDRVLDRDGDCRSGPNEGYTTAHSGSSGADKKCVSSQWCDNDSDSFFSNINSEEMKIFVGSSEDDVTVPGSGGRVNHSKDPGDHVTESDNSESYSITSNDDSDSHHDTVHNEDGDAGDNPATGYASNNKKDKTMTTGVDSIGDRVSNSYSEFGDSSSDIISCDTSSDDESCTSGSSDEKKANYTAPNDNNDYDTKTLTGNGMRQSCNAAEIHHSHKEMDDTAGKKEKRGRRRKMPEKEEPLWEPVALAEPEGDLTSWGALQLIYGNLTTLLQKWDHYSYLVRVFRRAYKLECERWREVAKRAHMHITLHFREREKRKEARVRGGWDKSPTKAPCVNTRVKYQGRKCLYGTKLWWVQNHVRWLVKYDATLNLKHCALIHCLLNKEQVRPSG